MLPDTLSFPPLYVLAVLLIALVILTTRWLRTDVTAVLVMLAIMAGGILSPEEVFGAFGEPLIFIVAATYVIGAALHDTGVAAFLSDQILRWGGSSRRSLVLITMAIGGLLSAVLGSLLVVVIVMPAVTRAGRKVGVAPAQLLMPLAMAALIGNQLTLIGTPLNLLVADLLAQSGGGELQLLSLTPYSAVLLLLATGWFALLGNRLLPSAPPNEDVQPSISEIERDYNLHDRFYHLRVRSTSDLAGERLERSRLRQQYDLNVVAVRRRGGSLQLATPDWVLETDDTLVVEGQRGDVVQSAARHGLELKGPADLGHVSFEGDASLHLTEAVVPPRSSLVDASLTEADLRGRYGLSVLAVNRQGHTVSDVQPNVTLRAGDILLVQGPSGGMRTADQRGDLAPIVHVGPRTGERITAKAKVAAAITGLMLIAVIGNWLSLAVASTAAALLLVLAQCISAERAYRSLNLSIVVLLGGLLPLATALERSGAADLLAGIIGGWGAALGAMGTLLLLYLLASVLTQVVPNMVVAALFVPVAVRMAEQGNFAPTTAAIAITFAANASYITPITNVINLTVQEPGGYTQRDFLRNGLPLFLLQTAVIFGAILWW